MYSTLVTLCHIHVQYVFLTCTYVCMYVLYVFQVYCKMCIVHMMCVLAHYTLWILYVEHVSVHIHVVYEYDVCSMLIMNVY